MLPQYYPPSPGPRSPALFSKSSYFPVFKDRQHSSTISTFRSRRFRLLVISVLSFLLTLWVVLRFANPASYSIHNINIWRSGDLEESQGAAIGALDTEIEDPDLRDWNQQAINAQLSRMGDGDDTEVVDVDDIGVMVPKTPLKKVIGEIQQLTAFHNVVVFSKTYCPYSKRAKEILSLYPAYPFHVVEVDLRDDSDLVKQALTELTGRSTFPNVFIKGTSVGGGDEVAQLHRQGKLVELLSA